MKDFALPVDFAFNLENKFSQCTASPGVWYVHRLPQAKTTQMPLVCTRSTVTYLGVMHICAMVD